MSLTPAGRFWLGYLVILVVLALALVGCGGGEEREPYVSCWAKYPGRTCALDEHKCFTYSDSNPECK